MQVISLCLGVLGANCYIASDDNGNAAVIDAGSEPERIIAELKKEGLTPKAILLTHGHFDHIMAAEALREEFDIPVYIHSEDSKMLSDENENLLTNFPLGELFVPVKSFKEISDGDKISVGDLSFLVMNTPGHSRGSCSFICEDAVFTGDTLFKGSIGRTDFNGGSYSMMESSLLRLKNLDGDYRIFPGHGPVTTLNKERVQNIYLVGQEDY